MLNEVEHHIPVLPAQMDKYRMALNTPSGIINLKNGEVRAHNPEYYFTKITSVDCSQTAECPRWLAFLDDILQAIRSLFATFKGGRLQSYRLNSRAMRILPLRHGTKRQEYIH